MTRMRQIVEEVVDERIWQKHYWDAEHDSTHDLERWISFIDQRLKTLHTDEVLTPLRRRELFIHIAALAIAAIEAFDEN